MSMVNPLAKARGHGSAKSGVHHWYAQRASALLLILLVAWLIYASISLAGSDFESARAFIGKPLNAAFLMVLIVAVLYHAMLGLQVVIEDYVHSPAIEVALYFVTRAGAFLGIALGVIHVLKLALGG
jgi:succinate dehydrogenase / fumarate reductase membrane anchor subunit